MSEREMFEQTFKRPKDFFKLSSQQQWNIDKDLGILDWEGTNLSVEDMKRYTAHYEK